MNSKHVFTALAPTSSDPPAAADTIPIPEIESCNPFQLTSDVILSDFYPQTASRFHDYFCDAGVMCYPFREEETSPPLYRAPSTICMHCGAYINHLSQFSRVEGTHVAKWMCSLCNMVNYGRMLFTGDCPEMQSHYYKCIEREPVFQTQITTGKTIVLGIDLSLVTSEETFFELLSDAFGKIANHPLAAQSHIFFFLFDQLTFRFLRIGEKVFEPLMVDIFPIHQFEEGNSESKFHWKELFQKGLYHLSVPVFLENYSAIHRGLRTFVRSFLISHQRNPSSLSLSVNSAISFRSLSAVLANIQAIFSAATESALFLFSRQSIPVLPFSASPQLDAVQAKVRLGRIFKSELLCSLFFFFLGNASIAAHELDPFLSMTDGHLIVCETAKENHFQKNLLGYLLPFVLPAPERNNKLFREAVLEIRCNHNIEVKQITGPLQSYSSLETSLTSGTSITAPREDKRVHPLLPLAVSPTSSEAEKEVVGESHDPLFSLFVDPKHFHQAYQDYLHYLEEQKRVHQYSIYEVPKKVFQDKCREYYSQNGAHHFHQILLPHHPVSLYEGRDVESKDIDEEIVAMVLLELLETHGGNVEQESENDYFPHWNNYLKKLPKLFKLMGKDPSERSDVADRQTDQSEEEETDGASLSFGNVQIAFKTHYYSPDTKEKIKETKVFTFQIHEVRDARRFLSSFRPSIWKSVQMHGLVADYHEQLLEEIFDKVLCNHPEQRHQIGKLDEQGNDLFQQIRGDFLEMLDHSLRHLSKHWTDRHLLSRDDIKSVGKELYFLREGGLLDGMALSIEESFLWRAQFLRSAPSVAHRLLVPRVWLDCSFLPSSRDRADGSSPFVEMKADATSLVPGTIALIDCGNSILVRRNLEPTSFVVAEGFKHETALLPLLSFAEDLAARRNPIPLVIVLPAPGSPQDRRVFARLSPGHMAAHLLSPSSAASPAVEQAASTDGPFLRELLASLQAADESFRVLQTTDLQLAVQAAPFTEQPFLEQFLRMNAASLFREHHKGAERRGDEHKSSAPPLDPARPPVTEDV